MIHQVASNGPQVSLHHPRWLTSSGSTRGCQRCIKGQGLVTVPFWVYWTSPEKVAIIDHIPSIVGWCSMGTFNDPWRMPKMHRCHEMSWNEKWYVSSPHALQSDTCCAKPEDVQSVQGMSQVTIRVAAWLDSALRFTTKGQSTRLHAAATADSMILLCHLSLCESTARCIGSQAKT